MDNIKLLERFFQVVAFGIRHKHYSHVVKKRKLYRQLVAGEDLDKLLRRFVRREDEHLFKQRVALTNHIVTSVCKNLVNPFYKVPRNTSIKRLITYREETGRERRTQEVENILSEFWGDSSWEDYLAVRHVELNKVDPNAFVVFEWDEFDADRKRLKPRPFEVSSIEAVDYSKTNNVLDYLTVEQIHYYDVANSITGNIKPRLKKPSDGKKAGRKYTMYGKNQTWQLLQVDPDSIYQDSYSEDGEIFVSKKLEYVKLGKNIFRFITYPPHGLGSVPAFSAGYARDPLTDGETYVNFLHDVEPYLLKTIKTNSELDLVATVLALPQLITYGPNCDDPNCMGGRYSDGTVCKTCNGTNIKSTAPSAQDAILLPLPRHKEEMLPIDKFATYLRPPVDIVKWQEEYIEKLTHEASRMLYSSDTFTKSQIHETATGRNIDIQNVYDTLYPFSLKHQKTFVFGVNTMSKLADLDEGLIVSYTSGKDFKFKGLGSLLEDLTKAKENNNQTLTSHINDDIASIIFAENPLELRKYKLKQEYNPFSGKTEKEILILLSGNLVSRNTKILYSHIGVIFDDLELKFASQKKDFYKLNRTLQREAIDQQVKEYIENIDSQKQANINYES